MLRATEYGVRDPDGDIHIHENRDLARAEAAPTGGHVVTRVVYRSDWRAEPADIVERDDETPFDVALFLHATARAITPADAARLALCAVRYALMDASTEHQAASPWQILAPTPSDDPFPVTVKGLTTVEQAIRDGALSFITKAAS